MTPLKIEDKKHRSYGEMQRDLGLSVQSINALHQLRVIFGTSPNVSWSGRNVTITIPEGATSDEIAALESQIETLQADIAALESTVLALQNGGVITDSYARATVTLEVVSLVHLGNGQFRVGVIFRWIWLDYDAGDLIGKPSASFDYLDASGTWTNGTISASPGATGTESAANVGVQFVSDVRTVDLPSSSVAFRATVGFSASPSATSNAISTAVEFP